MCEGERAHHQRSADVSPAVAEDNPDLRLYISSLLRKRYHVVEAFDGQAALEYALASPPDLVLVGRSLAYSNAADIDLKDRRNDASNGW